MIGHAQTAGYVVGYVDDGMHLWSWTIFPTLEHAREQCDSATRIGPACEIFALVPLSVFAGTQ